MKPEIRSILDMLSKVDKMTQIDESLIEEAGCTGNITWLEAVYRGNHTRHGHIYRSYKLHCKRRNAVCEYSDCSNDSGFSRIVFWIKEVYKEGNITDRTDQYIRSGGYGCVRIGLK